MYIVAQFLLVESCDSGERVAARDATKLAVSGHEATVPRSILPGRKNHHENRLGSASSEFRLIRLICNPAALEVRNRESLP
jgi:hypothetical protein